MDHGKRFEPISRAFFRGFALRKPSHDMILSSRSTALLFAAGRKEK
jgi:hypothetical protein